MLQRISEWQFLIIFCYTELLFPRHSESESSFLLDQLFRVFKACVCYFLSNFYFFTKWQPFKNYEKCFLFYLKSSFHSSVIQIFVFSSSHLFYSVSHCFRDSFKKNLKIDDVINCLNKNLTTNFVHLEKEIGVTSKLCPLIEY